MTEELCIVSHPRSLADAPELGKWLGSTAANGLSVICARCVRHALRTLGEARLRMSRQIAAGSAAARWESTHG